MKYKPEKIGNIIRAERKKHKMSQEELAKKLYITVKQVSNYENNKLIPPMDNLLEICNIFDCEMGYILGEKDYSQGTKLKTIVTNKTGLNVEAINAILQITGTGRECIDWGYNAEKYRKILNNLFTSKEFLNFIKTLAELDHSYQIKEQMQEIFNQLYNELGEPLYNKATNFLTSEYEEASSLTTEECEAIKKVNATMDECYELEHKFIEKMKVHRFSLHESLTLLLHEMYPMSD